MFSLRLTVYKLWTVLMHDSYTHFHPKATIFREYTVKFDISSPAFRRNILCPSSWSKSKPSNQQGTSSKENLLTIPSEYVSGSMRDDVSKPLYKLILDDRECSNNSHVYRCTPSSEIFRLKLFQYYNEMLLP